MKITHRVLMLLIGLTCSFAVGCSVEKESDAESRKQEKLTPVNAPDQYVRGVLNARNRAADVIGTGSINKAIQAYKMQYGKNPASLEELRKKGLLSTIPPAPTGKKYQYNPRNGTVALVDK